MVDNLRDIRPGQLCVAGGKGIFKVASVTNPKREQSWTSKGSFTVDSVNVRTVPPGFTGGRLDIDNYGTLQVCQFTHGDQEAYQSWLEVNRWAVDLGMVAVGEGTPITQHIPDEILTKHKFVKQDLMAYVIKVHGPMLRDDIMRMVAALEGMPWVPTSNTEYFQAFKNKEATLYAFKKQGQKKLYTLGVQGHDRADRVLQVVGEGPALAAK